MGNREKIVSTAKVALTDDRFERDAGMCQRFAREVIQAALGHKFDSFWAGSAEATRQRFKGTQYYHTDLGHGEAGDLLYFAGTRNQTAGHVMINLGNGYAAQNSVVDAWDKATGHKGTVKLSRVRIPTAIVRLW